MITNSGKEWCVCLIHSIGERVEWVMCAVEVIQCKFGLDWIGCDKADHAEEGVDEGEVSYIVGGASGSKC